MALDSYYSTGTDNEGSPDLTKYNQALASYYPYQDGSTYGRPGFTRWAYEDQRCAERIPTDHRGIMMESERVYEQVGLVRNILDLITDFTISGIRVVHAQPSVEKFYQNWFARISGVDRSERFAANLYKFGNVIIRRRWATLGKKQKKELRRAKAEVEMPTVKAPPRRIPARYIFLNPATVEVLGGDLAKFVGPRVVHYGVRIPMSFSKRFDNKDPESIRILNEIPEEIKEAAKDNGDKFIKLNPDDTLVFYYKKEDWQVWAKPILYGVFGDIHTLEKLKLADLTALDGATERVRIFKLGDLGNKIMPDAGAFSKLNELLRVNAGAGTRDIVWGPDIELIESNVESYKFLGKDKYIPALNSIFAGLGIPPTLTGTSDVGGTTNNLISLKSLIKRLEYGRQKLIEFWQVELELVKQAMGFQQAAVIEFDQNNLGDEEAEKRLFIELADRDIIPFEVVQRKFGLDPAVSSGKVENEWTQRDKGNRKRKASPFHNAQFEEQLKKSLLDRGQITPTEVGLELEPRGNDKINLMPTPGGASNTPKDGRKPNKAPNGRPPQKTDSQPRKSRRFTPVTKAEEFWAQAAQEKIAAIINPIILQKNNKKNMRSLTAAETEESEKLKFAAFFNTPLFSEVDHAVVGASLKNPFPIAGYNKYKEIAKEVADKLNRELTFAELHSIQIGVYLDGNHNS